MARIVHFEIKADDPERAIRFYRQALGWKIEPMGDGSMGYWLVTTAQKGRWESTARSWAAPRPTRP